MFLMTGAALYWQQHRCFALKSGGCAHDVEDLLSFLINKISQLFVKKPRQ